MNSTPKLKPRRLQRGDKIGIASPASPVPAPAVDEIAATVSYLEARGYVPVVGEHVLEVWEQGTYLAGSDEHRAADLNRFFRCDDIAAILCARGGYGSMRLARMLDWDALRASPKLIIGYSDITSLHLGINQISNLTSIHGKMGIGISQLSPERQEQFWHLAESPLPPGELPVAPESLTTLHGGTTEGELTGGCLTLLAHACGTPLQPDFRGKIVLLEDVGEAIYRADRCLTQLLLSGILEQAAGFVIGTITGWQNHEPDPPRDTPETLWRSLLAPLGKPILSGFPFGHEPDPLTLPLGTPARLNADSHTLTLLESPVS